MQFWNGYLLNLYWVKQLSSIFFYATTPISIGYSIIPLLNDTLWFKNDWVYQKNNWVVQKNDWVYQKNNWVVQRNDWVYQTNDWVNTAKKQLICFSVYSICKVKNISFRKFKIQQTFSKAMISNRALKLLICLKAV